MNHYQIVSLMFYFVPAGAVFALVFAALQYRKVVKISEGTARMAEIAAAIRKGANAYLKRQYTGVALFFDVMFLILATMSFGFHLLTPFVPFAFITSGFFSGLSGFIGMKIATAANSRTAHAAQTSVNKALRVSFSSGAVMGFVVVGLGLLDLSIWFIFLKFWYSTVDVISNGSVLKFRTV